MNDDRREMILDRNDRLDRRDAEEHMILSDVGPTVYYMVADRIVGAVAYARDDGAPLVAANSGEAIDWHRDDSTSAVAYSR